MTETISGFLKLAKDHARHTDTSTGPAINYLIRAIEELAAKVDDLETHRNLDNDSR